MTLESRLAGALKRWNLLESPFYQAWSAGALPTEALALYAREYGAFISRIADGWQAHGDDAVAATERAHVELWRAFARALGTDVGEAETPAVRSLVDDAERFFADPVESLGALYAFEAQQPATSASKLDGLRRNYELDPAADLYFAAHVDDEHEPALLLERMRRLTASDQQRAAAACERMAESLRLALDGLYDRVCAQSA